MNCLLAVCQKQSEAPDNGDEHTDQPQKESSGEQPQKESSCDQPQKKKWERSCSQCGATQTPQWREGPDGPKTLCNACGVKRVRQMKQKREQEAARLQQLEQQAQQSSEENRTHASVRNEIGGPIYHRGQGQGFVAVPSLREAYGFAAERDDPSAHRTLSSNSRYDPEELSHFQERAGQLSKLHWNSILNQRRESSLDDAVGCESAAAVDLLSMSAPRRHDNNGAQDLQPKPKNKQAWDNKTYANIANASLKHTHDAFVNLASTSEYIVGSLPYLSPQQQQQWWFLKSKVDGILQETAAADASVSAVAKVLAEKQALATESRKRAYALVDTVEPYMKQMEEDCHNARTRHGR